MRAAYLVDPVDGFAMTKSMLGYPSAVKLLRDRSMKLGITGKGVKNPLIPKGGAASALSAASQDCLQQQRGR